MHTKKSSIGNFPEQRYSYRRREADIQTGNYSLGRPELENSLMGEMNKKVTVEREKTTWQSEDNVWRNGTADD
jgi:hypothetical protein